MRTRDHKTGKRKPLSICQTQGSTDRVVVSPLILKMMYSTGSLKNIRSAVSFKIRNPLKDASLTKVLGITINGSEIPLGDVTVQNKTRTMMACEIDDTRPLPFPTGKDIEFSVRTLPLSRNSDHELRVSLRMEPFGTLLIESRDTVIETRASRIRIPSDRQSNCSPTIVNRRREFVEDYAGVRLHHILQHSFAPSVTRSTVENFTGISQIPLGLAGPLRVNGEHASGEFLIPLCTSEGTLVASYNRGMKIINMCGGISATIPQDRIQSSPVFVFASARDSRDFMHWIEGNRDEVRIRAEYAQHAAPLISVEPYPAGRIVYLCFTYQADGVEDQRVVDRGTFMACDWILSQVTNVRHFYPEANFASTKKCSVANLMNTRGKRVVAEITIPREIMIQHMRADPLTLDHLCRVGGLGAFMAGASNNGLHAANALAAMFIATGQDVANIAESSAGIMYTEITPEGALYGSLTLPSLIVSTHGGGTGLPTQRECLEILGCYGPGHTLKLAEIVTAVAAAGEISLAGALSSLDWVTSHELFGKNR